MYEWSKGIMKKLTDAKCLDFPKDYASVEIALRVHELIVNMTWKKVPALVPEEEPYLPSTMDEWCFDTIAKIKPVLTKQEFDNVRLAIYTTCLYDDITKECIGVTHENSYELECNGVYLSHSDPIPATRSNKPMGKP